MMSTRGTRIIIEIIKAIGSDVSAVTLILVNLFSIYITYKNGWDLGPLFRAFSLQFVILGITGLIKILISTPKPGETWEVLGKKRPLTRTVAVFVFLVGYGFIILFSLPWFLVGSLSLLFGGIPTLLYIGHHVFSFFYNFKIDRERYADTNMAIGLPLLRMFPLTIGITVSFFLYVFSPMLGVASLLLVKTLTDLLGHYAEHSKPFTLDETRETMRKLEKEYPEIYN